MIYKKIPGYQNLWYYKTMNNDITVNSWEELQRELFRNSWNERIQRYRSPYVFRGLSHSSYELCTSLIRLGGDFVFLEKHLLRNFQKYAQRDRGHNDTIWNWLAIAQHHGLPTRLMDWTYSPYIALHFATANHEHYNVDGAVWCVNYQLSNKILPKRLKEILIEEGSNAFTAEMLEKACSTLKNLDHLKDLEDFVVFFEPPSLDDRITNQFALFSFMSDATVIMDSLLENHPEFYFRIIIPASLKWEIRDKLDQANITERVLFPGLDGLSSWLRRQYSPRID